MSRFKFHYASCNTFSVNTVWLLVLNFSYVFIVTILQTCFVLFNTVSDVLHLRNTKLSSVLKCLSQNFPAWKWTGRHFFHTEHDPSGLEPNTFISFTSTLSTELRGRSHMHIQAIKITLLLNRQQIVTHIS